MSFINRIKAAYSALTKGDREVVSASLTAADLTGSRYVQRQTASLLDLYYGWVVVASNINATGFASVPLRVYRRTGGKQYKARGVSNERGAYIQSGGSGVIASKHLESSGDVEEITDPAHPLVSLLVNGWAGGSGFEMLQLCEMHLGITGNAYLLKTAPDKNKPVENLWPLSPRYVRVIPDKVMLIKSYIYGRSAEVEEEFEADRVVHFRRPNPLGDPIYGHPDLAACYLEAQTQIAIGHHALNTLNQGADPGGLLNVPGLSRQQRRELEAEIAARMGGTDNVGKWFAFNLGKDVNLWQRKQEPKELSYLASGQEIRNKIANAFGVPDALLTMESAALAQAKEAVPQWQKISLEPKCKRFADTLNQQLVPDFRRLLNDSSLFVAFDNPVTRDEGLLMDRLVRVTAGPVLTVNEGRAQIGYEPIEGGDELRTNAPVMPSVPPDNPQPKQTKATVVVEDEPQPPRVVVKQSDALHRPGCKCCHTAPKSLRAGDVRKDDLNRRTITVTETQLEAALRQWYRSLEPQVQAVAESGDMDTPIVQQRDQERLRSILRAPLSTIAEAGYQDGVSGLGTRIGAIGEMPKWSERSADWLRQAENLLIGSVDDTVKDRIGRALAESIDAGLPAPERVQRLQSELVGLSTVSAARIAQTEVMNAYHAARVQAWKDSGQVVGKEWLLSGDPCPICVYLADKVRTATLDRPFIPKGSRVETMQDGVPVIYEIDYRDVDWPPVHPNCRCGVAAIFGSE